MGAQVITRMLAIKLVLLSLYFSYDNASVPFLMGEEGRKEENCKRNRKKGKWSNILSSCIEHELLSVVSIAPLMKYLNNSEHSLKISTK